MKKEFYTFSSIFNSVFSLSLLLLFTFYSQSAKACVDPDTVATLTINYSSDFSEAEIRIGNLKLETTAPNSFCACGLSSQTDVFTYVTYIAIVYEGTNDVYPNFIPFIQTSPADDAWDGSQPALPDWNGYVAEVINGGLVADEAVEMIIRAEAPPNVMVYLSDNPNNDTSALYYQTYLGTDEWDSTAMDLKEDHQAIRTFAFMGQINSNVLDTSYFTALDNDILNSIHEVGNAPIQSGKLLPNPVSDYFDLIFEIPEAVDLNLVIYDITGKVIHHIPSQRFQTEVSIFCMFP